MAMTTTRPTHSTIKKTGRLHHQQRLQQLQQQRQRCLAVSMPLRSLLLLLVLGLSCDQLSNWHMVVSAFGSHNGVITRAFHAQHNPPPHGLHVRPRPLPHRQLHRQRVLKNIIITTTTTSARRTAASGTSLQALPPVVPNFQPNDILGGPIDSTTTTTTTTMMMMISSESSSNINDDNIFLFHNNMVGDIPSLVMSASSSLTSRLEMSRDYAEQLAGPFFGASLFPYLAFLWLLARPVNNTPKGVTVGFATCLLFVFLTIPAAIAAQLLYGVSLADSDWLHGSAESLLTITNLVTVVAFRQALSVQEQNFVPIAASAASATQSQTATKTPMPRSATMWSPMIWLVTILTVVAIATAVVPALNEPTVHTPYLGGFLDLPSTTAFTSFIPPPHSEPKNALTIATWIIHISSLVEFLVAMGFCWRWADVTGNPTWRGLTWGLLPLHSSGITACTYHLFYNQIPILVPFQALLTCVGNTTAALAAYRIARSNGWSPTINKEDDSDNESIQKQEPQWVALMDQITKSKDIARPSCGDNNIPGLLSGKPVSYQSSIAISPSLVGFEDLGQALARDNDYSFLLKLFVGCAVASYAIKYGEIYFDFPFEANVYAGFGFIFIPSLLNAYKWYRRSKNPSFEGWF